MSDLFVNFLSILVTVVVLPLLSILGTQVIKFIKTKIKDEETAKKLMLATQIITSAVQTVFQTYVDSLKNQQSFDLNAQQIAFEKAKEIVYNQLTEDLKQFIQDNYGNVEHWLHSQIESTIYRLKNK